MEFRGDDKIDRVLGIYSKLMNGSIINKSEEAQNYGVNERSIQRDIEDIRNYLDKSSTNTGIINTVIYDRLNKGYRLEQIYEMKLSNSEILAICKILLDSRAFTKKEMIGIISRLVDCCVPKVNRKEVNDLIQNEEYHYIELQHRSEFIDKMWDIGKAIREHNYVEINYQRVKDKAVVTRKVKPVSIMFSEYYFYVTAFIDDEKVKADFDVLNDAYPTIYRIDRIKQYKVLEERFRIPYANRFEEGEFRKRIQFMYGGKLQKVKFTYSGNSIEAVLDRLPTASIESEDNGVYTISAEVFGKGIEMWLKSQGDMVQIIEMR
ncbi:WYL domain-containing protein [Kandleria vitulina]|uniref:WYL domain-containing protein n=1 Tax=Kandleria vitulina TaxID=1630 RepID=A0A1H2PWZ0_9FIRM|nr:WYL domain-containing protein [Kandleria vitulina]SDV99365.1 WYL domain-containing protein [Kandleria vitulina]